MKKQCIKCSEIKEVSEFYHIPEIENNTCIECSKIWHKEYRELHGKPVMKMLVVHEYDDKWNLKQMYFNVIEAVDVHPELNAVSIYKACEAESEVGGSKWSFSARFPKAIEDALSQFNAKIIAA